MFARSLFMRLLLSFAMILNGSVAIAGVMPGMATAGDASAAESLMADSGHCDEMDMPQAKADSGAHTQHRAAAAADTADPIDHDMPDCCKSGLCQCACVQATTTVALLSLPLMTISTPTLPESVDSGVAATHAPRLDRPPIG